MDPTPSARDDQLEEWLRASRPQPQPAFVRELEARVIPRERASARRSRRPFLAGMAAAAGTAATVLVLALGGVGPFSQGDDGVHASDNCRYVSVTRVERVPEIIQKADGKPAVRYRKQTVHRRVQRCR